MFETTVSLEYAHAHQMGLTRMDLVRLAEASFHHAFLSAGDRQALLEKFHTGVSALGLV
jgi:adenosine deaminase